MKIKKYVKNCVVIAEDNTLWQFTGLGSSSEVKDNLDEFFINNNKLYYKEKKSFYNPIRQLSDDEIVDYLEYII